MVVSGSVRAPSNVVWSFGLDAIYLRHGVSGLDKFYFTEFVFHPCQVIVHETPTAANNSWSKVDPDLTGVHARQLTMPPPLVIKAPREEVLGVSKHRVIVEL